MLLLIKVSANFHVMWLQPNRMKSTSQPARKLRSWSARWRPSTRTSSPWRSWRLRRALPSCWTPCWTRGCWRRPWPASLMSSAPRQIARHKYHRNLFQETRSSNGYIIIFRSPPVSFKIFCKFLQFALDN